MDNLVKTITSILIVISVLAFQPYTALTQNLEIKRIEIAGGDVILSYDLIHEDPAKTFTLNLYSSSDNFLSPVTLVDGDVGLEVSVGTNKHVIWHVRDELGSSFKGGVELELRGRVFVPFIKLDALEAYKVFKRGKQYEITWTGGSPTNVMNFELFNRNEELVHVFPNVANVGQYTMVIPTDIKPGNDFHFKISDQKNKDDMIYSGNFKISRKYPLVLKVAAGAILAGGLYLVYEALQQPEVVTIQNPPDPN